MLLSCTDTAVCLFQGPAKQQLATCHLPHFERLVALKEAARDREDAATFDVSRLADLSDRPLLSAPAAQVTLLLRMEPDARASGGWEVRPCMPTIESHRY